MPEIKPAIETFARIKVIGVGGSGHNAISRMMNARIKGVEFVAVNTDAQSLHHNRASEKIHIGKTLTKGLGAGMDPSIGRQAAEESREEIQEVIKNSDMVFITCGLGGGTGTGAAPVVAEVAKECGALTVAVVTKPFMFEGAKRLQIAEEGFEELVSRVDTIITIPNEKLLQIIDRKTSLLDAFKVVDDVLRQGVQGISDLITIPGIINVDFADVKAIMKEAGSALMGIGKASGENRAAEAAKMAINNPLLELSIDGAKGVLFNISGGPDLSMIEINEAAKVITESIDPNAKVIFGAVVDETIKKGEIRITVIATGFGKKDIFGSSSSIVKENDFKKSNTVLKDSFKESPKENPRDIYGSINSGINKETSNKEAVRESEAKESISDGFKDSPLPSNPVLGKKIETKTNINFNRDISTVEKNDEFDIPAFIRRKMNNNDK